MPFLRGRKAGSWGGYQGLQSRAFLVVPLTVLSVVSRDYPSRLRANWGVFEDCPLGTHVRHGVSVWCDENCRELYVLGRVSFGWNRLVGSK